jgi:putative RecB family exonuclease
MADYSPSKLTAYMDCPLKYRFSYIDRIKKPDNVIPFVGTIVHETLREVVEAREEYGKELGFDEAALIFERIWDEEWKDDIVIEKEYLAPDDYRGRGLRYLEKYFEMEEERERWEVVALEKGCGFDIRDTGRTMGGFIDRLERKGNSFRIIDYKCSKRVLSQDRADEDHQLGIYELALRELYPDAEEVTLEWYFLGAGEVASSTRTAEQRAGLEREIVKMVRTIEADTEFLPLGTRWCPCEYAEECEAEKRRRTLDAQLADRDLAEVVDDYAEICEREAGVKADLKKLEAEKQALEPRLADCRRETGAWSIEGTRSAVDIKRREVFGIPSKGSDERLELEEIVRDAGIWERVSDLNKTSVLDAIDNKLLGGVEDDALGLFEKKEKFTFKPRRKGY